MSALKLVSVSLSVELATSPYTWDLGEDGALRFKFLWDSVAPSPRLDGFSLRDDFLALRPGDAPATLDFLNRTGVFAATPTSAPGVVPEKSIPSSPEELWTIQSLVRVLMLNDRVQVSKVGVDFPKRLVRMIESSSRPDFHMDWSGKVPTAVVSARTTISALLATIQVDHWTNTIFRACAKPDCGNVFEIEGGRNNKIYCDHICAQHQATRAYRKRKTLEKKKAISGADQQN